MNHAKLKCHSSRRFPTSGWISHSNDTKTYPDMIGLKASITHFYHARASFRGVMNRSQFQYLRSVIELLQTNRDIMCSFVNLHLWFWYSLLKILLMKLIRKQILNNRAETLLPYNKTENKLLVISDLFYFPANGASRPNMKYQQQVLYMRPFVLCLLQ